MAPGGSPFIKSEPTDIFFNENMNSDFDMNGFNDADLQGLSSSIDPAQLHGGNMNPNFDAQSSSFMLGNSGIADDELADLAGSLDGPGAFGHDPSFSQQPNMFGRRNTSGSMPMAMPQHGSNLYSSTPDGMPIQSPFVNVDNFNYNHFDKRTNMTAGNMDNNMIQTSHLNTMDRRVSDAFLSASSGAASAIRGLHIGDPADYSSSNNMQRTMMQHRHSTSLSNNWDAVGAESWQETPRLTIPSGPKAINRPSTAAGHSPGYGSIASSLPVKMEPGLSGAPFQSQEAKKRRRRECHNIVERRRRDNINERIHDLGILVPQHRLEDDKVKKHLQTNSPMSPSIGALGTTPPAISSSLPTGSLLRRASGVSTLALPSEEKDKAPNKGDILNTSVAWARDVVWYTQLKMQQEEQLKQLVQQLGGSWPFEQTDDEIRMRSELHEVIQRNSFNSNIQPYSRAAGSGLRVPGFTNLAGEAVRPGESDTANQHQSSAFQTTSNMPRSWQYPSTSGLKEEDEDFDDDIIM